MSFFSNAAGKSPACSQASASAGRRWSALLCLLVVLGCWLHTTDVTAQYNQACCDNIGVLVDVPDVVPQPCCRRISVYRLPSLNCDIYGIIVAGAGGGIPLQSTPITLFGMARPTQVSFVCPNPGETREVSLGFLDSAGNLICSKTVSVSCPSGNSCCDSIGLTISRPAVVPQPCCRQIAVYALPGMECEVYGVNVTGASGGIPLQGTPVALGSAGSPTSIAFLCPNPGETITVTLEFLDASGNVICSKTAVVGCLPQNSCCDALGITVERPDVVPQPCCRRIAVYQLPNLACGIYGVTVTGAGGSIPLQGTPLSFGDINNPTALTLVCPNPGETRGVLIEFLDASGNVICSKSTTIICPPEGFGKQSDGQEMQTPLLNSYPNPTTGETRIDYTVRTAGAVKVELFDPMGQLVSVLEQGGKPQGVHSLRYNAAALSQGVYLLRLTSPDGVVTLPFVVSGR